MPGLFALEDDVIEALCRHCSDWLYLRPDLRADEYVWMDEKGSRIGRDTDLREWDVARPYDFLNDLGAASRHSLRRAQEYAALKVRLDVRLSFHWHYPRRMDLDAHSFRGPDHCHRPMWLRPSGWHCRQCPFVAN